MVPFGTPSTCEPSPTLTDYSTKMPDHPPLTPELPVLPKDDPITNRPKAQDKARTKRKRTIAFLEPGQKPVVPVGRRALGAASSTTKAAPIISNQNTKALPKLSNLKAGWLEMKHAHATPDDTKSIASDVTGSTTGSTQSQKVRASGRRGLATATPEQLQNGLFNANNSKSLGEASLPSLATVLSPLIHAHDEDGTEPEDLTLTRGRRALQPTREGLITEAQEAGESDGALLVDEIVSKAVQPFAETALPDDPDLAVSKLKEAIINIEGEPQEQRETAKKILTLRKVETEVVAVSPCVSEDKGGELIARSRSHAGLVSWVSV